jgi:hypothetical protein
MVGIPKETGIPCFYIHQDHECGAEIYLRNGQSLEYSFNPISDGYIAIKESRVQIYLPVKNVKCLWNRKGEGQIHTEDFLIQFLGDLPSVIFLPETI